MYRHFFKHLLDLLLACILLIVTAPIMFFCAVSLKITQPDESVIFKQPRVGYKKSVFNIYKFRTMITKRYDINGRELTDDERLTKLGSWMRKLSLDELPQIFNVLLIQMSFIGPRPLLVKYLPYYTKYEMQRHNVIPGISGWAQVNGRNAISWEERLAMDVWYVEHCSFWLDIKIIFMTFLKIFKREGISSAGEATMPEFFGSSVIYPDRERKKEESISNGI